MTRRGTARVYSLKTALPHVPLIFASCIFCLVGRDLWLILHFSITPIEMISTSWGRGFILQMLALPHQMCYLSLIETCGTICLNGIMPRKHTWFISCQSFTLMFFPSPHNPKELFNLCHASAHNVIEQIFGILKQCFWIFHYLLEYDMSV